MPNLLAAQLDYVQFLFGLALILLGAVCVSRSRAGSLPTPWWLVAAFAFTHGAAEWLALLALAGGEPRWSGLVHTALVAASFLLLLEFARRTSPMVRGPAAGAWIHLVPVAGVALLGLAFGAAHLEAAIRLLVAAPAAFGTGAIFLVASARTSELGGGPASRRARRWGGLAFGALGLAAGLVAPRAPFLPAAWPTAEAFLARTGVPIQLPRGLVVFGLALAVWALAASFDHRGPVLRKRRVLFWVTATSIAALVAAGWLFTDWLGRLGDQELREEAQSSARHTRDHLLDEMRGAEGGARSLAALLARLPAPGSRAGPAPLDQVVDALALASDGLVVQVLDRTGTCVAASNRRQPESQLGKNLAGRPWFQAALAGAPSAHLGQVLAVERPGYHASHPVPGGDGRVEAVAVVERTLTPALLASTEVEESFVVSPDGRILVASRPGREHQLLWYAETPEAAGDGDGQEPIPAILDHAVAGTEWVWSDGQRRIAVRLPLPVPDWSLVVLRGGGFQVAPRLLGIVITLLLCAVVLSYSVAMQRQLQAELRISDRRREAEGRAREYARQADTDPLTGVLNRLGLNGALARELERARRYRQPLSLLMLDLDHFKRVNDEHGHVAGDRVLVGVARLLEANLRESDAIARWGGEEFVVVTPMSEAQGACRLAEKLRACLEATPLAPGGALTGSFGVAELQPGEGLEALLHRADQALYLAKSGGRNRVECAQTSPGWAPGQGEPTGGRLRDPARPHLYAETGFTPIDREHRALGEAIEGIIEQVDAGSLAGIQASLGSLIEEVSAHFGHEEELMESLAYPLRQRHQQAHARFLDDARAYLEELDQTGLTVNFRRWATRRLLEWLRFHVEAHDVALGRFLRAAGAPPERDQDGEG